MTPEPPSIPVVEARRVYMECKADACGQHSERCPCPQVCEVPLPELPQATPSRHYPARLLAIALAIVGAWLYLK